MTLSPDLIDRTKEYTSQDCKKRGEGSIAGLGIWRDQGLLAETQILLAKYIGLTVGGNGLPELDLQSVGPPAKKAEWDSL